jgi:hypothetical protein
MCRGHDDLLHREAVDCEEVVDPVDRGSKRAATPPITRLATSAYPRPAGSSRSCAPRGGVSETGSCARLSHWVRACRIGVVQGERARSVISKIRRMCGDWQTTAIPPPFGRSHDAAEEHTRVME